MSSSLLTPASAMTALRNLTASVQGRREGTGRDLGRDGRSTSDGSSPAEASRVGPVPGALSNPQSYVTSLSDAIASGVGSLVRADMDVSAARLRALQAQKLLGTQAVSIANQHSQLVLKLFGG